MLGQAVWRCSVVVVLMTDDKPPDYGADKKLVRHEMWPLNYLYFCHTARPGSGTVEGHHTVTMSGPALQLKSVLNKISLLSLNCRLIATSLFL